MKMPFFHGVTDREDEDRGRGEGSSRESHESKQAGDGLHHHENHDDEGGGIHSKHTHPDGRVEHTDHASIEEAHQHEREMRGDEESRDEEPGRDGNDDFDADDMAGSYGRAGE